MKLTTLTLLCVLTITTAIRVPNTWFPTTKDDRRNTQHLTPIIDKYRTIQHHRQTTQGSEIPFKPKPLVHQNKRSNNNKVINKRPKVYLKGKNQLSNIRFSNSNDWIPIIPQNNKKKYYPLYKNYRDDKTHEPEFHSHHVKEREQNEKSPETEDDIPTRPIYPGEGKWAKRGRKYRPYITKQYFTIPEEIEERPDGYDIFESAEKIFNAQRDSFGKNLQDFPEKHKLGEFIKESSEEDEIEKEDGDEEFTPIKLYAQVRRSEDEEHLPYEIGDDGKLREVIKDSKIQTVYTEEGYEDSAYDHAGHEKKAENDEGYADFDKDIESEKEKKVPKNLVLPKHVYHEVYRNGDNDVDLENYKKEKLSFEDDDEDSVISGTEYKSPTASKKPSKRNKKKTMTTNNFIKTKETKTMAVKDKGNGTMEMEISSEVKVITQPNNSTKSHKFVKIYPKIYKQLNNPRSEEQEEITTLRNDLFEQIYPDRTDVTTTEETKVTDPPKVNQRRKRFVNDFPKISVETDFIDKINHDIPNEKIEEKETKYPYYEAISEELNENSPLRYSEDLKNIPEKSEGQMAFYEQADGKFKCPEVETEIDPIPDHVKNAEQNYEGEEKDVSPKSPRLGNLGDKIDCFKRKYFGENPLDSPIFKDDLIEPVKPIFNLDKVKNFDEITSTPPQIESEENEIVPEKDRDSEPTTTVETKFEEESKPKSEEDSEMFKTTPSEEILDSITEIVQNEQNLNNTEVTPTMISIITTPNYTIDLKPKHIYDQIDLLQYLPYVNESERQPKLLNVTESLPETQALIKRRRRVRPRRPMYQVFDVNRYLPTTPYPMLRHFTSTVMPKYKVVSEVFYKDEIKPNEQLNVFADIINNIKNNTLPNTIQDSTADYSEQIATKLNSIHNNVKTNKRIKIPKKNIRIKNLAGPDSYLMAYDNLDEITSSTTSTTTMKPIVVHRGRNKYKSHKNTDQFYEELFVSLKNKDDDSKIKAGINDKKSPNESIDYLEDPVTDVLGLVPPGQWQYRTIYDSMIEKKNPTSVYSIMDDTDMNKFLVVGMKPPDENQKAYLYSDYKLLQNRRRFKRSANRPAYSELSRNRGKQEEVLEQVTTPVTDDIDDYVPHRPRNYHYDEKTGKIVYDKVEKQEEPEEEIEYVEIIEERTEKPKSTTVKSIFIDATSPAPGKSYIDFIKKLKSHKDYHEIPDPTTTEKGEEPISEGTTPLMVKLQSTKPPEFLSILAKVKSDDNYKVIEDPDEKKKKKTSTTAVPDPEEVEIEEESQLENVQNSPGGQILKAQDLQIFDISDFLPKVKNYLPKTSVDTSKYKTIERPVVRHNLSSRYNEEEPLENVNTSRKPLIEEVKESESKEEIVSTTTELPTTKRPRVRGRTRITTVRTIEPSTEHTPQHDKAKRNFRRRPTRIKIRTTTEKNLEEESDDHTKIIRRRSETETSIINTTDRSDDPKNNTSEPRKLNDVEVFQKFDTRMKHGGNYRRQPDVEETRLTDIVHKPFEYYSDPKLPKNINQLKEVEHPVVPHEELESIVEDDHHEHDDHYDIHPESEYDGEEVQINFEKKIPTTKKPVIVKDPSKRLYYYATP